MRFALLPDVPEPEFAEPLALLRAWDHAITPDSAAALLFVQWF